MRKSSFYTLSAAAVMLVSTALPLTSLAAVSTYRIPYSYGGVFALGTGGQNCLPGQLGGQGRNGSCNQNDCGNQNHGWGAGPVLPDNSLPQVTPPGFEFPTPELPGSELPGPELPGSPDGELPDAPDSQDAYADQVVKLVNAERAKAGLNPLTVDGGVAEAAQVRAEELTSTFSHTRPDGSSFSTILDQSGVSYRAVGENIAYGQSSPEAVMQGWMNSSGHRSNILSGSYTSIGVGHYKDAGGTDYWTQLFIN